MERIMRSIDKDASGTVEFKEFQAWWDKQEAEEKEVRFQIILNART